MQTSIFEGEHIIAELAVQHQPGDTMNKGKIPTSFTSVSLSEDFSLKRTM
jgi:hypothetical protein